MQRGCRHAAGGSQSGDCGNIAKRDGKFVWKDTYAFLMNLDGHMLAHPIIPQLTEKGSLLKVTDKNKKEPKLIFIDFVEVAKNNGEGWVGYMWPKPGQADMLVGAGIYK